MTTILSKLVFSNEYVVILNEYKEAIGLEKVTSIVGRVIFLKNGSKYNETDLTSMIDNTQIAPYYNSTAHRQLKEWKKDNKIKKFKNRILFDLFKIFAFRFTFDTCSKLAQEKLNIKPMKYVITPNEIEQVVNEDIAKLYKGEYYDYYPIQN